MTEAAAPPPAPAAAPVPAGPDRRAILREAWTVVAAVSAVTVTLAVLARFVPLLDGNLSLLVALLFFAVPSVVVRYRGLDEETYLPLKLAAFDGAALQALLVALVIFPLFAGGFWLLHGVLLHRHFAPHLPRDFGLLVLTHLVLVAMPEEFFFRGYLQRRLDDVYPQRWRVLGVAVGPALVIASAAFAVVHVVVEPRLDRLAVFFPGLLFGWLRARTKTIWAPALLHGTSNLLAAVLEACFYY